MELSRWLPEADDELGHKQRAQTSCAPFPSCGPTPKGAG